MQSLISYYGGKQRLASKILPILESVPHKVYVEPFAGGASLLFAKRLRKDQEYKEGLNDIDPKLMIFYKAAKRKNPELLRSLQNTLYSQYEHRLSVEILRNYKEHSDGQVAWAYYVNTQQSFAKQVNSGWGYSVASENHSHTWAKKLKKLELFFDRLKDVYLSNFDGIRCIDMWDSPNTLFYCDPPYPGTSQGHYEGYTLLDYQCLIKKLEKIKGVFVLSNYFQKIELPNYWTKTEIKASMSVSLAPCDRHRTELLITNL